MRWTAAAADFSAVRASGPVRAVVFDVDGTLYDQRPLRACMAAELGWSAAASHSVAGTLRIARILQSYRAMHERLRGVDGNGDSIARLQIAGAARLAGVAETEVDAVVAEWMFRRPLKYLARCRRSGLVGLLSELQRRGVRLGVLSDYPSREKLAALGVEEYFASILCTTDSDINALKPDPRGFRRACEAWSLPPDEVLYVGDRPDVDARGALAAGLRCAVVGKWTLERTAVGAGERPVPRLAAIRGVLRHV
jgi:FMN phosphatase YigB (HAD superfamily)